MTSSQDDRLRRHLFICALQSQLEHSVIAAGWFDHQPDSLLVCRLVAFEFRQSIRAQVFRHNSDRGTGLSVEQADTGIVPFNDNVKAGGIRIASLRMHEVFEIAEDLSSRFTEAIGCGGMDVQHVAAATCLKATTFLTFDVRQRQLAELAGMKPGP